jgi:hypothetical protein
MRLFWRIIGCAYSIWYSAYYARDCAPWKIFNLRCTSNNDATLPTHCSSYYNQTKLHLHSFCLSSIAVLSSCIQSTAPSITHWTYELTIANQNYWNHVYTLAKWHVVRGMVLPSPSLWSSYIRVRKSHHVDINHAMNEMVLAGGQDKRIPSSKMVSTHDPFLLLPIRCITSLHFTY